MKTKKLTNIIFSIGLALGFVMPTFALAAAASQSAFQNAELGELSGIKSAVSGLGPRIDSFLSATTHKDANLLYQVNQDIANTENTNINLSAASINAQKITRQTTMNALEGSLAELPYSVLSPNNKYLTVLKNRLKAIGGVDEETRIQNLAKQEGTDNLLPDSAGLYTPNLGEGGSTSKPTSYDGDLDFGSLVAPQAYNSNEKKKKKNFIQYVTQQYKPISSVDLSALKGNKKEIQQLVNNPTYQQYKVMLRSNLATSSIALSNLNHLLSERIVQKGLGNDTSIGKSDVSPLQLENYVANHRIASKQWYQNMNSASPAVVQRETLFVLAEIESQLQRMHLDNERLLSVMSVMELQTTKQTAALTGNMQTQAVQSLVDKISGKKSTSTSKAGAQAKSELLGDTSLNNQ